MAVFTLGALTTVPVSTRPELVAAPVWESLVASGMQDAVGTVFGALLPAVIVGSGIRRSKLMLPGGVLAGLAGVEVIEGLADPAALA